jgi:hypothetical protein
MKGGSVYICNVNKLCITAQRRHIRVHLQRNEKKRAEIEEEEMNKHMREEGSSMSQVQNIQIQHYREMTRLQNDLIKSQQETIQLRQQLADRISHQPFGVSSDFDFLDNLF